MSKTAYSTGELCCIKFAWAPPNCEERETSEKFKWKYMSQPGIDTLTPHFLPDALVRLTTGTDVLLCLKLFLEYSRMNNVDQWQLIMVLCAKCCKQILHVKVISYWNKMFSIISIQNNLIPTGYDFKIPYLLEYWLDRSEIWNTYWVWSLDNV